MNFPSNENEMTELASATRIIGIFEIRGNFLNSITNERGIIWIRTTVLFGNMAIILFGGLMLGITVCLINETSKFSAFLHLRFYFNEVTKSYLLVSAQIMITGLIGSIGCSFDGSVFSRKFQPNDFFRNQVVITILNMIKWNPLLALNYLFIVLSIIMEIFLGINSLATSSMITFDKDTCINCELVKQAIEYLIINLNGLMVIVSIVLLIILQFEIKLFKLTFIQ